MPCRCRFPAVPRCYKIQIVSSSFEQHSATVIHTYHAVLMLWPCRALTMPLCKRRVKATAGARHGMCALALSCLLSVWDNSVAQKQSARPFELNCYTRTCTTCWNVITVVQCVMTLVIKKTATTTTINCHTFMRHKIQCWQFHWSSLFTSSCLDRNVQVRQL
jgi:hypothetical protein